MSILHKFNEKGITRYLSIWAFVVLTAASAWSQCTSFPAYTSSTATIDLQSWNGRLGLGFTPSSPIVIDSLGAFDSGAPGFAVGTTITVGIVDGVTGLVVAGPLTFTNAAPGTLRGNFRSKILGSPVTLTAGTNYFIVAHGYNSNDQNGNTNGLPTGAAVANTGGGLITFGTNRYDGTLTLGVPGTLDGGPTGRYHSATFSYRAVQPTLTTLINGISITTNNDGNNDLGSFSVCNGTPLPNINVTSFNITGGPLVKVQQEIVFSNTVQSGAWCTAGPSCVATAAAFTGVTNTFSLINSALPGSVILRFRSFVDADGDSTFDDGECPGDWAVYTVNINHPTASITPDPAEACILTNLQLNGNPAGGSGIYSTHLWTRVGVGSTFLNNNNIVNPIFNHNTIGMYTLRYTVTDNIGCTGTDEIIINLRDVGLPDITCPTSPVTMTADTDRCTAVVCFPVSAMDLCPVNLPNTLAGHTFIGTFNGHTYFRSNSTFSWETANQNAVNAGGHLVSVNSLAEKNWLLANTPNNWYWIGLRYSPSLEQFKWTSGEPLSYTNWGLGQPGVLNGDYVYSWEIAALDLGWFDGPGLINRRYIVEFEGFPVTLVSGLPSGSNFPVGTTPVRYRATDSGGNSDECTFDVVVTDDEDPVIVCPTDIIINLDPTECGRVVNFTPTITDNCPGVTLSYLTPLQSGDIFPIGTHIVTLLATDNATNTDTCSFRITINEFINNSLACQPIQSSLGGDCRDTLTVRDVLVGWDQPGALPDLLGCDTLYKINVKTSNGQNLGPVVSSNELDKTLTYTITHPSGFSCSSTVKVEDKIKPRVICRTDSIKVSCLAKIDTIQKPQVWDNCPGARVELVDLRHTTFSCDPNYIGRVLRTWRAVDSRGLVGDTLCTDSIYLRRSTFVGITPAPNATLRCNDTYQDDGRGKGYPHPNVTGVPKLGTIPIWPTSQLNMLYCSAIIDYEDQEALWTDCKKRILRVWTITEWWCNTSVKIPVGMQIIDIIDDIKPSIPQLSDMTISTESKSCKGRLVLDALNITDNCNPSQNVIINAVREGSLLPTGVINGNGGTMLLDTGWHIVTYKALDKCGNDSTMRFRVLVEDKTDPVALCDELATISLKANGYTEITAAAVNDGSYDECGPVTVQIRRMDNLCGLGQNVSWFDKVGFCCLDGDQTRMVELRVRDLKGNENFCMVSVRIQNKVTPTITCPAPQTKACDFTFDPANLKDYFGPAIITGSSCVEPSALIDVVETPGRNQCGIGHIIRRISLPNAGGTCTQRIDFTNSAPDFDPIISWPRDTILSGQCSFLGLDTTRTKAPRLRDGLCSMIGVNYKDAVFPFTTNGACYKIIRTWKVIDWCQRVTSPVAGPKTWEYEQEIKVMDTDAPELDLPAALAYTTSNCDSSLVEIIANADDCTPQDELKWNYAVRRGSVVVRTGSTNVLSAKFAIGDYKLIWRVEDRCGNLSVDSTEFSIKTIKAASVVCKNGLASRVTLMDTDGNGSGDTYMTRISAKFFDNKSVHPCDSTMILKYSFSPSVNDTIRTYNRDSIGTRRVTMYVTDRYNNQAYCSTFIDIQDTLRTSTITATVSGRAVKEDNETIEGVVVSLNGSELPPISTDKSGVFKFGSMPGGGKYQVVLGKDGDDINGVSTLDAVMIQRHILGIETLKTPYQMIAADANGSGSVSAADITELRKLLLGVNASFQNNTSWRFVDAAYKFPVPSNPWHSVIAERYNIDNLDRDMNINFVGIKIGDVNGNAKGSNFSDEIESRSSYAVVIDDIAVKKGDKLNIPVKINDAGLLHGTQTKFVATGLKITQIADGGHKWNYTDAIGSDIRFNSVSADGLRVQSGETLLVLRGEATQDGLLSTMLALDPNMKSEMYTEGLENKKLTLQWRDKGNQEFVLSGMVPNPWNTQAVLSFQLPAAGQVKMRIMDYTGRVILSSSNDYQAGSNTITINRSDLGNTGVYLYELRHNDKVLSGKMIVID
ncbi:MAG: HYR domain-containing protein [Saprospiraceae bacterium]|nr:HYR domain-containing protein [Saprospiraceae bacterium]